MVECNYQCNHFFKKATIHFRPSNTPSPLPPLQVWDS